jgi:DNA-binding NarL/FixJ family response regulator
MASITPAAAAGPARARRSGVVLIDDHPLVRQGVKLLLEQEPGFEVKGEASSAAEALSLVLREKPDVAVVDISLEDTNGVELVKDIRAMAEQTQVVVSSMHDESVYAQRALRAGALAYVCKDAPADQLVDAIKQVAQGRVYVSPTLSDQILRKMVSGGEEQVDEDPIASLSDRELEVFQLIGQGLRTREIADRLCLSVKTIETYRENIKEKLNFKHGTELIQRAVLWTIESANAEPAASDSDARSAAAEPSE